MFWNKNGTVINLNEINLEENEYRTRLKNFENITASIINPTLYTCPRFTDWLLYAHAKLNKILWTYDILLLASKLWYSETIFWTDDGITSVSASVCVLLFPTIWILCGWICNFVLASVPGTVWPIEPWPDGPGWPWVETTGNWPATLLLSKDDLSICFGFQFGFTS